MTKYRLIPIRELGQFAVECADCKTTTIVPTDREVDGRQLRHVETLRCSLCQRQLFVQGNIVDGIHPDPVVHFLDALRRVRHEYQRRARIEGYALAEASLIQSVPADPPTEEA